MKKLLCLLLLLAMVCPHAWSLAEDADGESFSATSDVFEDEDAAVYDDAGDDEGADNVEDEEPVEGADDVEDEEPVEGADDGDGSADAEGDASEDDVMPAIEDDTFLAGEDEADIMLTLAESSDSLGMPTVTRTTKGDIANLQRALIQARYLEGEADGVYGDMTSAAVDQWCADNGIDPTGESAFTLMIRIRRASPAANPAEDRVCVYVAQRLLYQWGFLADNPDGKNGKNTKKALSRFMEYAKADMTDFLQARESAQAAALQPSVIDDGMPRVEDELLVTSANFKTDGTLTQAWFDFITSGYAPGAANASVGTKGVDALRVQNRLHKLKYIAAGMDGSFGKNTALALKYFQKRNRLKVTGKCDDDTARVLFSDGAKASDKYVAPYMARVVTSKSKVYILKWTGEDYTKVVKTFTCSCGKPSTPTKKGTYQAKGPVTEWYYMATSHVWVKYAFQIKGNYFFHSVLFSSKGSKRPTSTSVYNLGRNVSHGCVRLSVKDARWIFKNCPAGMTVVVQ